MPIEASNENATARMSKEENSRRRCKLVETKSVATSASIDHSDDEITLFANSSVCRFAASDVEEVDNASV